MTRKMRVPHLRRVKCASRENYFTQRREGAKVRKAKPRTKPMNREDFPPLQVPLPDLSLTVYSVIARRLLRKPIRATLMATEIISDSPARVTRIWLNRLAPFLGLVLVIAIFAILIGDPAHYLSPKNL